jgi:hypothetical protein
MGTGRKANQELKDVKYLHLESAETSTVKQGHDDHEQLHQCHL